MPLSGLAGEMFAARTVCNCIEHIDKSGTTNQPDGDAMTHVHEDIVRLSRKKIEDGKDQAQILHFVKNSEHSITEAIKLTREIFEIPLGRAKEICETSLLWRDQVSAAKPLHDDLERLLATRE